MGSVYGCHQKTKKKAENLKDSGRMNFECSPAFSENDHQGIDWKLRHRLEDRRTWYSLPYSQDSEFRSSWISRGLCGTTEGSRLLDCWTTGHTQGLWLKVQHSFRALYLTLCSVRNWQNKNALELGREIS